MFKEKRRKTKMKSKKEYIPLVMFAIIVGFTNIIVALLNSNWHSLVGWLLALILYFQVISIKGVTSK